MKDKLSKFLMGIAIISFAILVISGAIELFTPIIKYGSGATYGYITTIEQGILYDRVWIRADYTSSQTDCYALFKESRNTDLQARLNQYSQQKQRVVLKFEKYLASYGCTNDFVIDAIPINQ
jgi:hypothetical protein